MYFCALMIEPANAIQVQLKCSLKSVTSDAYFYVSLCKLLCASLGAALMHLFLRRTLNCTDKLTINFLYSFTCFVEWILRCSFKYSIELQFHIFLNHLIHSYVLTIAWTSATQVQPEVHLLILSQMNLSVHRHIDLAVQF